MSRTVHWPRRRTHGQPSRKTPRSLKHPHARTATLSQTTKPECLRSTLITKQAKHLCTQDTYMYLPTYTAPPPHKPDHQPANDLPRTRSWLAFPPTMALTHPPTTQVARTGLYKQAAAYVHDTYAPSDKQSKSRKSKPNPESSPAPHCSRRLFPSLLEFPIPPHLLISRFCAWLAGWLAGRRDLGSGIWDLDLDLGP